VRTTGLHFHDVAKLLDVLTSWSKRQHRGVIEHNLEVIKTADWIIDLAPRAATPAARSSPGRRRRRRHPLLHGQYLKTC